MSWHHGDYIDLFSAIGGVASAAFAAFATWQARKSTDLSRQSIEISRQTMDESIRQADIGQLRDELIRLSERCNLAIDKDSLVRRGYADLMEFSSALKTAHVALNESTLPSDDKSALKYLFIRHLRPGIIYEISQADALFDVPGALGNDVLRQMYRDAQIFFSVDKPRHIP